MSIYWTLKSFPELTDLEPWRRKTIWRACWLCPFQHWQTWAALLSQCGFGVLGAALGAVIDGWPQVLLSSSIDRLEQMRVPVFTGILFWLGGLVGGFFFFQIYSRMIRPYLQKYLESHHVA